MSTLNLWYAELLELTILVQRGAKAKKYYLENKKIDVFLRKAI